MGCGASTAKVAPPAPAKADDATTPTLAKDLNASATAGAAEATATPTGGAAPKATTLRIFHVNDVYDLGNLPALKTCIDEMSAGADKTLKVLAGDFLAPSVLSSVDHGKSMVEVMNLVGFDVVCFGNHECDVPNDELYLRINELEAVCLNSNMRSFTEEFEGNKLASGKCPDNLTVQVGDKSVVLIGLNCGGPKYQKLYRPTSFGGHASSITAPNEVFDEAVARAKAACPGAACLVPLTHQNKADDLELAQKVADELFPAARGLPIPCILGGHDHGGAKSSGEKGGVYVCKAEESAADVCIIDLTWEAGREEPTFQLRRKLLKGKKEDKKKGKPAVPADFGSDAALKAVVNAKGSIVEGLKQKPLLHVGSSPLVKSCLKEGEECLTSKNARIKECSVGTMLATALKGAANLKTLSGPAGPIERCHGAVINGGSVRKNADYPEGDFTFADLMDEVTFPDPFIPVLLPGSVLSAAIADSRAIWKTPDDDEYGKAGKPLHCDDRMKVDPETLAVLEVDGEPLEPDKEYTILMGKRLCVPGSSNAPLAAYAEAHPEKLTDPDVGGPPQPLIAEFLESVLGQTE